MKKKLEADLISIAHRILQLKNKSDINQLYLETQKLYEKLSVLRFVDEHFSEAKPTIGRTEIDNKIESIFETTAAVSEPKVEIEKAVIEETVAKDHVVEEIAETPLEETEEITPIAEESSVSEEIANEQEEIETAEPIIAQTEITNLEEVTDVLESADEKTEETQIESKEEESEIEEDPIIPAFEISQIEEVETELEVPKKAEAVQISFEDLLGGNYHDTLFVKKQQVDNIPTAIVIDTPKEQVEEHKPHAVQTETIEKSEPKIVSLNDKLAKGINIDLNDRLAFIKHLFGNSSEDYNRVLSQLITFDTFYETRDFVQEMVKPDYNNWEGKQEYEERFMDIIEKKFL